MDIPFCGEFGGGLQLVVKKVILAKRVAPARSQSVAGYPRRSHYCSQRKRMMVRLTM
jgi:hypothetical protein